MLSLLSRLPHGLRMAVLVSALAESTYAVTVSNSSSALKASITPGPTLSGCKIDCGIAAIRTDFYWNEMVMNTTITAATKLIIIDEGTNKTSTSLIFNDLPSGYTLPPMNEAGTQTWDITFTVPGGEVSETKLTWPTRYKAYPLGYEWSGTFPTSNSAGQPVCLSASDEFRPYPSYMTSPQVLPAATYGDQNGLNYSPVSEPMWEPVYTSVNPKDPILQSCTQQAGVAPAAANPTASFLTVTSTSRKKAAEKATSTPVASSPTPVTPKPSTSSSDSGGSQSAPPAQSQVVPVETDKVPPSSAAQQPGSVIPGSPQATAPASSPAKPVASPLPLTTQVFSASTATISGSDFTFVVPVAAHTEVAAATQVSSLPVAVPQQGQTIVNGMTFAPLASGTAGPKPGSDAASTGAAVIMGDTSAPRTQATIIDGQTFTPVVAPAAGTSLPAAPPLVVAGSSYSAVATVGAAVPVYNVGGQALTIGSTVTLGSGSAAQTVALQTDNEGNTVLVTASTGDTGTTTIAAPSLTTSTAGGVGDYVGSGIGGTKTSAGPAQQTTNAATHARLELWAIGAIVVGGLAAIVR